MEVKSLGGGKNFARTINYLGTTGDMTPAHKNIGILGYKKAKQSNNRKLMDYFSPYLRRDLMTFGNMPCGNKRQISHFEQSVMSGNSRKIKSREFILMPSDKDKISPHDPNSILRFKKYIINWADNSLNGYFKKVGKNKRGNARYKFIKNGKQNFNWYAVIQPDSHNNSRVHAHIVVLNNNLMNNKSMGKNYYNIYHLRRAVDKVSKTTGFSRATRAERNHAPSREEKRIIEAARKIVNNPNVTSRPKFIRELAKNGVTAKFRRNRKNPSLNGWKFKYGKKSFIKSSRISHATGGSFLATDSISKTLSENRKMRAKLRREKDKQQIADFSREQADKLNNFWKDFDRNYMIKLRKENKLAKRKKKQRNAHLFRERTKGLARVQQAVKNRREVLSESSRQRYRNDKETKQAARLEESARNEPKSAVDIVKNGINQIKGFIRNKLKVAKNAVKSVLKPAPRHKQTGWRDYKKPSIQADRAINRATSKAIGKKPRKPTHQSQSSVATTPKSSSSKANSVSSSKSMDNKILKRAEKLRKERDGDEPPL